MAKGKKPRADDEDAPHYRAAHRRCPMSAHKIRPVLALIRGLDPGEARDVLKFVKKRAAYYVDRVLLSAMANAEQMGGDVEELCVAKAVADEGTTLKRWKAGPHGRVRPILRRRAHIEIELGPS
jgi:large subunit ribosomal protein L22